MGDLKPLKRNRRTFPGANGRRGNKRNEGWAYPLIVGGMALAAVYGIFNTDKMPGAVVSMVNASRDLGRRNTPPAGAYYWNCDAARAAGVAPIYAGEPGYREELDGDRDGIACEPYRGR